MGGAPTKMVPLVLTHAKMAKKKVANLYMDLGPWKSGQVFWRSFSLSFFIIGEVVPQAVQSSAQPKKQSRKKEEHLRPSKLDALARELEVGPLHFYRVSGKKEEVHKRWPNLAPCPP